MGSSISRRSVASGAAWAAPALIVGSASPSVASSASSGVAPQVCQTIQIGDYESGTSAYPLSFTFGGSTPDHQSTLNVTIEYPVGESCPSPLLSVSNPCDGMTSTGGSACRQVTNSLGETVWQAQESVSGAFMTYQHSSCGNCPFIASVQAGLPEGAVVTLSNQPEGGSGAFPDEPGPYWSYTFTLGGWGSAQPNVITQAMSNLAAPLNVVYV